MPSPSDAAERPGARVLRQLVEALLFERIVDAREASVDGAPGFEWAARGRRFRCRGRIRGFGRVRVDAQSVETLGANGLWRGAGLDEIVDGAAATPAQADRLLQELRRTASLCRWNEDNLQRATRRTMSFAALDCALDEGHPYHPCFKARTGFAEADHAAFGPEAGATFQLVWLMVRRDLVSQALACADFDFWRRELGAETFEALWARRAALGLDAADFMLAPMHPWQFDRLKDEALAPLIADGSVHALGAAGDRYAASQSVRTLHNVDHPRKSSVKLAMNMANTSSLRTIDPHSVCVAPALSRWLGELVAGDPQLNGRVAILAEHSGQVVDREGPLAGQLATIWRESAEAGLVAGERAVPFNALTASESDGFLVQPWLDAHGARAWAERLIEVAVVPVWRLLVTHGVALEAHGQNMILVHRDGWPERLMLRDFHDSLEYVPDFLADPGAIPDLAAIDPVYRDAPDDLFHRMSSVEELRALVMDSLFVFCLSDLAFALEDAGALGEPEFWDLVRRRLSRFAETADPTRLLRLGWRAPTAAVERLLAPKLERAPKRSVAIPNPFSPAKPFSPARPGAGEPMIEIDDKPYLQAEFDALAGRWAERALVGRPGGGGRYAVCLPATADWLAVLFAIREAGASVLPIHPATPYAAARRLAGEAGCDRLIFADRPVEALEAGPSADGRLLQMTSGTTGAPKCIARGWDEIERELASYVATFRAPDDMTPIVACPTTHSYGLICGVLAGLKRGRAPVVVNVTNPKALLKRLRETDRPLLYSSPAMLHTLAKLSPAGEQIHAVMTSGTLLPAPWFAEIRAKSRRMFQQYGCSEAGVIAVNQDVEAADDMGEPLPHLVVAAGEGREAPAEIVVTGPGGEIRTRDLGYLKLGGGLVFVSRLDDTINVSGLNVYPGEVENVATAHPAVADAVAFRIADPFAGERVGLMVSGSAEEGALRDWCRANLASHQVPVDIVSVAEVPRQANGKISRREVAALYASGRLSREAAA